MDKKWKKKEKSAFDKMHRSPPRLPAKQHTHWQEGWDPCEGTAR